MQGCGAWAAFVRRSRLAAAPASIRLLRSDTLHSETLSAKKSLRELLCKQATMAAEIENDYLFHNDNELTRLALQHVIIKDATKGKQVFAPIKFDGSPLQILDACTGDGKCKPRIPPLSHPQTDLTRFVDP
jgi:hypothetical protein